MHALADACRDLQGKPGEEQESSHLPDVLVFTSAV